MIDLLKKIHCGDCIKLMDAMPEKSVGLIVASPPYNLRRSSGGGLKNSNGGGWKKAGLLKGYAGDHRGASDDLPYPEYVQWQRKCLTSMMRVLRDDGAVFYNHKWRVQGGLIQDRHEIVEGFPVRQIIIWARSGGFNHNPGYFLPTYEVIYLICKRNFRLRSKAARARTDVWRVPQDYGNPHPAPFPVEIPKRCIEATDAEIVLDPFMGSGTTAIAAEMIGRQWIGFEIAQEYVDLANDRIHKFRNPPESNLLPTSVPPRWTRAATTNCRPSPRCVPSSATRGHGCQ